MAHARFAVIREATEVVFRHLERLPPSDRREQLLLSLQERMQEIEMWSICSPTATELDMLTKRVLGLHIEVTRLERSSPIPEADPSTSWKGSAA